MTITDTMTLPATGGPQRPSEQTVPGRLNPDWLYTPGEAARILGVSAATMERWRSQGLGPVVTRVHPTADPRYRGTDLLDVMSAGREARVGQPPP